MAFRQHSLDGLVIADIAAAKFCKLLDDKRTDLLPLEKQGPKPTVKLTKGEHAKSNLFGFLERWDKLN